MKANGSNGINKIAKPLVDAGLYNSVESVVKDLVKHLVKEKIEEYREIIEDFSEKYGSLEKFSVKIKEKATTKQEDEWLEWEASENMLIAWKSVARELDISVA